MNLKIFFSIIYFLFLGPLYSSEEKIKLLEIYKNLRCLVCQGQSIADSNSDFAATIKLVVQDQVNEGKTKNEIYTFLISKYGEWIVYQPTFSKSNLLLWIMPYFIFIVGGLIIFMIIRKSKRNKAN
jgi:cytochrome c-type biogenesis protein CcmH|tara:strand:- start:1230 stop:1607 length:378 start_codon:yes stop_codon:yes gene_type:complete